MEPVRTLKQDHYEMLQRMLERMKAKYPQAELDLHTFSSSLWAFTHPIIEVIGEVS